MIVPAYLLTDSHTQVFIAQFVAASIFLTFCAVSIHFSTFRVLEMFVAVTAALHSKHISHTHVYFMLNFFFDFLFDLEQIFKVTEDNVNECCVL